VRWSRTSLPRMSEAGVDRELDTGELRSIDFESAETRAASRGRTPEHQGPREKGDEKPLDNRVLADDDRPDALADSADEALGVLEIALSGAGLRRGGVEHGFAEWEAPLGPFTRLAGPGHGQGRLGRSPSSPGRRTVQPFEAAGSPWCACSPRPIPTTVAWRRSSSNGRTRRRSERSTEARAGAVRAFLLRVTGGRAADAEEALQECWLRAVESLHDFRWESNLRSWLRGSR
jgi:hypothetical protein